MTSEIRPVRLFSFLEPCCVGNMEPDTPRYVPSELMYLDETSSELYVDDRDVLSEDTARPTKMMGRVGLMCVAVVDQEKTLVSGYVADLRYAEPEMFDAAAPATMPEDEEVRSFWFEDRKHLVPIAAIAYSDPETGRTAAHGDTRFADAALHLAMLLDGLKKEQQGLAKAVKKSKKANKKASSSSLKKQ